ncbi:HEAT repeat domain-containing protein [bacterium]|nr:HEAT repeat domain-containing protein [bacterium]
MKTPLVHLGVLLLGLQLGALAAGQAAPATSSPAARRMALIQQANQGAAAVPALAAGLQDANLVVRRTAVRLLIEAGTPARPALTGALDNADALVRRAALSALCDPLTAEALPHLKKGLADADPLMRLTAVQLLVQLKPRTQEMNDLLEKARTDEADAVREVAAAAVWPFFKETVSIRDRKDWDHDIKVSQEIPLPTDGWRFKTDPKADGHLQKWYEPTYNDSAWLPIKIGAAWEEQGQKYDGVAWYRGSFDLPAKPQCLAVEIAFGGVDEIAWVWVNGQYVGQHDLGTEGWDKPFALDVTKELKWGEKNQITVRVYDSAYAGGIWKPVTIQVLQ